MNLMRFFLPIILYGPYYMGLLGFSTVDLNRGPPPCRGDVITTRPQALLLYCLGFFYLKVTKRLDYVHINSYVQFEFEFPK